MAAHVHADLMKLYAEDAQKSETPWNNWEVNDNKHGGNNWAALTNNPIWNDKYKYRRKQDKVYINNFEINAPVRALTAGEVYYEAMPVVAEWFTKFRYDGSDTYNRCLERVLIFATKSDAIACAKAMVGVNPHNES